MGQGMSPTPAGIKACIVETSDGSHGMEGGAGFDAPLALNALGIVIGAGECVNGAMDRLRNDPNGSEMCSIPAPA